MKTYKDIASIPQVKEPMDADQFWMIAEMACSLTDTDSRDYEIVETLSDLTIREIIGFPLRLGKYLTCYTEGKWTKEKRQELAELFKTNFEHIAVWTIFQGREFYMEVHDSPEVLKKKVALFSGNDIPRHGFINGAIIRHIGMNYIDYMDFIHPDLKPYLGYQYEK